jgi:hypothetical protein
MSVKIDVERVVRETVPMEFSLTGDGDNVVLWAKWMGEAWAVGAVSLNGLYPFGGFPKDFPIKIDPETQRVAITTK